MDCVGKLADQAMQNAGEEFALVGYSMGGRIAILAALELLRRGHPPSTLVLLSAGLGYSHESERAKRRKLDEEWATLAEKDPEEFWLHWYQQDLFSSYFALPAAKRAKWEKSRIPMELGALSWQLRKLGPGNHEDLAPILGQLLEKGLRVLYIVGELDKKYLELAKKVQAMEGATVAVLAGAGHILPFEAPEAVAHEIQEYFR